MRVIRCSDDEFLVKHGTRSLFSALINDPDRTKLLGRIVDRLATKPARLDELEAEGVVRTEEAEAASQALGYLPERGVITPASEDLRLIFRCRKRASHERPFPARIARHRLASSGGS